MTIPSSLRTRLERLSDQQVAYVAEEAARRADRAGGAAETVLTGLASECADLLLVRAQIKAIASILDTRRDAVETLTRMSG